jgi:DNA invertase Pin-like site-specific DNA recombinase
MREYAVRRGWMIAVQVREINSGAVKREARERLLEAARRREIDVVLVWRLDRWGCSETDLLATLQEERPFYISKLLILQAPESQEFTQKMPSCTDG